MTRNQIQYWELRWKQHYEAILAQIKVQELQLEWAKHQENVRRNKEEERISWAELDEKIRAAVVAEGLRKEENFINAFKANVDYWYKINQVNDMLAKQEVAAAEFAIAFEQAKNEDARKWLETEATLLKNGWDKYAVSKAVGEAKAGMSNERYDNIYNSIVKTSPNSILAKTLIEAYGPEINSKPQSTDTSGSYTDTTGKTKVVISPSANAVGPGPGTLVTGTSDKGISVSAPSQATPVANSTPSGVIVAPQASHTPSNGPGLSSSAPSGSKVISSPSVASRASVGPGVKSI